MKKPILNRNIKYFKQKWGIKNDEQLASKINEELKRSAFTVMHPGGDIGKLKEKFLVNDKNINSYIYTSTSPKNEVLYALAKLANITLEELLTVDFSKSPPDAAAKPAIRIGSRRKLPGEREMNIAGIHTIITDFDAPANVLSGDRVAAGAPLVDDFLLDGKKWGASGAGQSDDFADVFNMPDLPYGEYRAFKVFGNSMEPLPSGSIIVAEQLAKKIYLKARRAYVIVKNSGEVVYKRIFKLHEQSGNLILCSDNTEYEPYIENLDDIHSIWEPKRYLINNDISNGSDSLDQAELLYKLISGLEEVG